MHKIYIHALPVDLMRYLNELESEGRVKILIGKNKKGSGHLTKPTKTILLIGTTVEEVFKLVQEALRKRMEEHGTRN